MQSKPQRTSDQMYPIIKEYLSTQSSQRVFCKENHIEIHALRYWLKKYREELESGKHSHFSTIEIEVPTTQRHILIRTKAGVEIQIPV